MADGAAEDGAEGAARGAALERAYVHDVYENAHAHDEGAPRPDTRVHSFLAELEPGSLVCDVGCGGGQYLSVNPSVFSVGGDRCTRLAKQAHQSNNEVVVCDNLALPFRDEAFDAVVSVAVVHHFATVERRARALRELARVTRIGGRLLLTVWAMEHEGRDFHSQDVLIPWHAPGSSPPADTAHASPASTHRSRLTQQQDLRPHAFLSVDNDRYTEGWKCRTRGGETSPGSSSLASPNETCYSFVRRALQRLAGRRSFLHSWSFTRAASAGERIEREDTRDARDFPIELRRIDDEAQFEKFERLSTLEPIITSHKSRSLTDISDLELRAPVRSRSSLPGLSTESIDSQEPEETTIEPEIPAEVRVKPKLVKQKKSINEEDDPEEDLDKPTDMRSLVEEMPDFKIHTYKPERRLGMFKQSSLNEELMSVERLREKEHLRKNIQKQASLNEEYLYRRQGALDSLRDSIFLTSATTAKKFQSIKNGLTNKFKSSTTNMDKVTVIGFVKMFQGWKSQEAPTPSEHAATSDAKTNEEQCHERRHSREDGSDSSKDSSLQSDTSVDSEDSFASVIFVPKADGSGQEPLSPTSLSSGPTSPRLKVSSVPTSPRLKSSPGLPPPRLIIVRPPLSPKSTQAPVQLNKILLAQYSFKNHSISGSVKETRSQPNSPPKSESDNTSNRPVHVTSQTLVSEVFEERVNIPPIVEEDETSAEITSEELIAEINRDIEEIQKLTEESEVLKPKVLQDVKPYPKITLQTVSMLPEIPQFKPKLDRSPTDLDSSVDKKRKERIRQVREMLKQGFPSTNSRSYPMVRRGTGKESGVKPQPRLVSLELFNPETDDMDSDSSGVSSPDSVDSVISVVPEELRKQAIEKDLSDPSLLSKEGNLESQNKSSSTQNVIQAVAEVAQTLEETCEMVIQISPQAKRRQLENSEAMTIVQGTSSSSSSSNWSLNKLSPGDLRLLDAGSHSHSHTSSSGSSSSLDRLSPVTGRRSKERSPKQGSTSNSTWSLNRLSPSRAEGRSLDENTGKCHRSPTRFPYDCVSVSSTDSDKSISKSDSFHRLQADERLVTCKSDIIGKEEERAWNEDYQQNLSEFAEKISEKLLHEIDQYSKRINEEDFEIPSSRSSEESDSLKLRREEEARNTQKVLDDLSDSLQHLDDPYMYKISSNIHDLGKLNAEILERNKYLSLNKNGSTEDINRLFPKCGVKVKCKKTSRNEVEPLLAKYRESKRIIKASSEEDVYLNNLTNLQHDTLLPNDTIVEETTILEEDESVSNGNPEITVDSGAFELSQSLETGYSIESEMSIDSFSTDKRSSLRVSGGGQSTDSSELDKMEISPESVTSRSSVSAQLKSGFSIESSDTSASDWSRRDKTGSTASLGCSSITSLPSCSDCSKERKSSSPLQPPAPRLPPVSTTVRPAPHTPLQSSLSDASADSLPSEGAGGAVTFHRYYHVFRQGELDQLIDKYVENLHVVSSYYDHSSWCVVAEKVQVWTI